MKARVINRHKASKTPPSPLTTATTHLVDAPAVGGRDVVVPRGNAQLVVHVPCIVLGEGVCELGQISTPHAPALFGIHALTPTGPIGY